MRKIAVVTTSRADFGIWRPVLREIQAHPDLELSLYVTGMHLSFEQGYTIREIEEEGFDITARIECLLATDSPQSVSKSIGLGTISFAQEFERECPDVLFVLGDRFEMLCAVLAAIPFAFPIAHLHGGEITQGAIDESIRHAITKMSHVHFASTHAYAQRIIQMGEDPWRVLVSGAPSLDNLHHMELATDQELSEFLEIAARDLERALLVTFHPVTLDFERSHEHIQAVLDALDTWSGPIVITQSNADTSGHVIREAILQFCDTRPRAVLSKHLGTRRYFGLMTRCAAMVGNSSSGIIEAASFGLPVVNIGLRQHGRVHDKNVLSVPCQKEAIIAAINEVTSEEFKASMKDLVNPYGDGHAAKRIVEQLATLDLARNHLVMKRFYDLDTPSA